MWRTDTCELTCGACGVLLLLAYAKEQSDGGRAPVLVVQARSNPDLKWEFLVQEGPPQSVLVRLRRAVRLVRLQYECQYDCGFLKSVELTVAGRESNVFS